MSGRLRVDPDQIQADCAQLKKQAGRLQECLDRVDAIDKQATPDVWSGQSRGEFGEAVGKIRSTGNQTIQDVNQVTQIVGNFAENIRRADLAGSSAIKAIG